MPGLLLFFAFVATPSHGTTRDLTAVAVATRGAANGDDMTDYMAPGNSYCLYADYSYAGLAGPAGWHIAWYLDGEPLQEDPESNLIPGGYASAGTLQTTTVSASFVAPAGVHTLTLVLDNRGESSEADEGNNILNRTFTVGGPWAGAADAGQGWRWLSWFGCFWNAGGGWTYHAEHGWLHAVGTTPSSLWLWSPRLGWLWTANMLHPFLWSDARHAWLWYYRGTGAGSGGWFYDFGQGSTEWL